MRNPPWKNFRRKNCIIWRTYPHHHSHCYHLLSYFLVEIPIWNEIYFFKIYYHTSRSLFLSQHKKFPGEEKNWFLESIIRKTKINIDFAVVCVRVVCIPRQTWHQPQIPSANLLSLYIALIFYSILNLWCINPSIYLSRSTFFGWYFYLPGTPSTHDSFFGLFGCD